MIKVKQQRTADCVVGGFRYAEKKHEVGSLLLGLYDDAGPARPRRLHLGHSREGAPGADQASSRALIEPPGFTGNAPGGPSRWNTERIDAVGAAEARAGGRGPLRPGHRRAASATAPASCAGGPTRTPQQCTFEQLAPELRPSELKELFGMRMSLLFDDAADRRARLSRKS